MHWHARSRIAFESLKAGESVRWHATTRQLHTQLLPLVIPQHHAPAQQMHGCCIAANHLSCPKAVRGTFTFDAWISVVLCWEEALSTQVPRAWRRNRERR